VIVPATLIKNMPQHYVALPGIGIDVIMGKNGCVRILTFFLLSFLPHFLMSVLLLFVLLPSHTITTLSLSLSHLHPSSYIWITRTIPEEWRLQEEGKISHIEGPQTVRNAVVMIHFLTYLIMSLYL
jgi:hypothetical protein